MYFDKVVENAKDLMGSFIEISGIFVLWGDEGYLVARMEDKDSKKSSIKIELPDIKRVLMSNVPPLGGSKYYYLNESVVFGKLEQCLDGEFLYLVKDIESMKVIVSDEVFTAI